MRKWLAVLLVVSLMAVGILGCGNNGEPAGAPGATGEKTESTQPQGGGSELSSIVEMAKGIKEMSFDIVSTMTGKDGSVATSGKYYISGDKLRMEMETMGMKMITIGNEQGEFYLYNPETKTAMKMTTPQTETELPNEWAQAAEDLAKYKVVGEEKKDGYDCLVVTTDEEGIQTKMWLRQDIGMPVRVEATLDEGETMVVEYKNYSIGEQPAELFEIPAGTEITTLPGMSDMSDMMSIPKPTN